MTTQTLWVSLDSLARMLTPARTTTSPPESALNQAYQILPVGVEAC